MKPLELTPDGKLKIRIFLGMESPADLLAELERCRYLTQFANEQANSALKGRRVRITHEWHDQPIGRSKPDLKGKVYLVTGVVFETLWPDSAASLWLEGLNCAVPCQYVEILP